jgi:hypothetical protein
MNKPKPVKGAGGRIQMPLRKSGPESKRCFELPAKVIFEVSKSF